MSDTGTGTGPVGGLPGSLSLAGATVVLGVSGGTLVAAFTEAIRKERA